MKTDQVKIVVAGIGGVGGYFGGLLAKKYADSQQVQVYFIARGQHLAQIQKKGLTVIKGDEVLVAKPHLATDQAAQIGIADFLIICTKNYDLQHMMQQLAPCIGKQTVVLPLLNGIEAVENIKALVPNAMVVGGCAYIVSAIKAPGIIENIGNRQDIYFGLQDKSDPRLEQLQHLLQAAGISSTLSDRIDKVIWEKFIFLSCIATATAYFNQSIGQLLATHANTLTDMIKEVMALAAKKGIKVDEQMQHKAMQHYQSLPFEATSSMHRDYLNGKPQTELESLTGYVVRQAQQLHLAAPLFELAYKALRKP